VRSDNSSNWFTMIHVWNYDLAQGPMLYCFYYNGDNNTFNQCYVDSPFAYHRRVLRYQAR
jgi:hypothetical protein